ncbi:hypothetical protein ACFWDB_15995, partial [Micromonospora chalcea]
MLVLILKLGVGARTRSALVRGAGGIGVRGCGHPAVLVLILLAGVGCWGKVNTGSGRWCRPGLVDVATSGEIVLILLGGIDTSAGTGSGGNPGG